MSHAFTPSFAGLKPASPSASRAGRGSSRKTKTSCELVLRRELSARGLRYRVGRRDLPGRPDIVFFAPRIAVFCDGDFWHGRNLEARIAKLARGHNPSYWVAKVRRNVERDMEQTMALETLGWVVLRFWETEIRRDVKAIARKIISVISARKSPGSKKCRHRNDKLPSGCKRPY
jgi:DNA mismatch endonuclease (patch repair protein)